MQRKEKPSANTADCFDRLQYEQRRDTQAPLLKIEATLEALREELVRVQSQETEAKKAMDAAAQQLEEMKQEADGVVLNTTFLNHVQSPSCILKFATCCRNQSQS